MTKLIQVKIGRRGSAVSLRAMPKTRYSAAGVNMALEGPFGGHYPAADRMSPDQADELAFELVRAAHDARNLPVPAVNRGRPNHLRKAS